MNVESGRKIPNASCTRFCVAMTAERLIGTANSVSCGTSGSATTGFGASGFGGGLRYLDVGKVEV